MEITIHVRGIAAGLGVNLVWHRNRCVLKVGGETVDVKPFRNWDNLKIFIDTLAEDIYLPRIDALKYPKEPIKRVHSLYKAFSL